MTEQVKRLEDLEAAPVLGVPLPTPEPEPGCSRCDRLAEQRKAARADGNWTRVSDCNIEIRRCTH